MVNKAAAQDQEFLLDLNALQASRNALSLCSGSVVVREQGHARALPPCTQGVGRLFMFHSCSTSCAHRAAASVHRHVPAAHALHDLRCPLLLCPQKKHIECAELLLGPGPELNTFVARLLDDIANLKAMLQAISIGGCWSCCLWCVCWGVFVMLLAPDAWQAAVLGAGR